MEDKDLQLLEESKQYVSRTGKWMMFFAIVMGLYNAFMILIGLGIVFFSILEASGFSVMFWAGFCYLVLGGVLLIPSIILYRCSKIARCVVSYNDNERMVEFLKYNKFYWEFWGILTISMIGISFVAALVAVVYFSTGIWNF